MTILPNLAVFNMVNPVILETKHLVGSQDRFTSGFGSSFV